jgi:hypothetical protein
VTLLKRRSEAKRRPFTVPELGRVLEAADDEWRGLIAFGVYTCVFRRKPDTNPI